jgi:hypothetical protein
VQRRLESGRLSPQRPDLRRNSYRCLVTWTFDRIQAEWLQGGQVALSPDYLVRLFEAVEAAFGEAWFTERKARDSAVGAHATLHIANMGQLIEGVTGLSGGPELVERVRVGEPGSVAEALVVAAMRADLGMNLRLSPTISVGQRIRKPDVLAQRSGESVYTEVSSPQLSREYRLTNERLHELANLALEVTPFGNASEIYFHREPSDQEVAKVLNIMTKMFTGGEQVRNGDVANVVVNSCEPGQVVLYDHPNPYQPRLSTARFEINGDRRRHAVVRYPFTDARAARFLRREAQQLSPDHPGILVLHVSGAPGAVQTWVDKFRERLQPAQHTRVSAIVLLESAVYGTPNGEAWMHTASVLLNDHAAIAAPRWALAPFRAWTDGQHALQPQ